MTTFREKLAAREAARNADKQLVALKAEMGLGWAWVERVMVEARRVASGSASWETVNDCAQRATNVLVESGGYTRETAALMWARAVEIAGESY